MSIKHLTEKLKQQKGETLTETLVALMIGVLALAMLAAMIGSTTKMVTQSQERLQTYYSANSAVITKSGEGTSGYGVITPTGSLTPIYLLPKNGDTTEGGHIPVQFYSNTTVTDNPVVAYKAKE